MKPLNLFKTTYMLAFCLGLSQPLFAARPGAFNNQLELFYLVVLAVLFVMANVKQVAQLVKKHYLKLTLLFKG
jgi:hypothetical protein